jgi:hypothetical protein
MPSSIPGPRSHRGGSRGQSALRRADALDDGGRRVPCGRKTTVGCRRECRRDCSPPTIQALLAARLDLLGPEERSVIEAASGGRARFPEDALHELVPDEVSARLEKIVHSLCRKHLVQTGVESIGRGAHYRFAHVLVARPPTRECSSARARGCMSASWAGRSSQPRRDRAVEFEEILGLPPRAGVQQPEGARAARTITAWSSDAAQPSGSHRRPPGVARGTCPQQRISCGAQ